MNIRNAIKQLALSGTEMYLTVCTVDSVDEEKRTIECTPIDEGAQLLGVNLQADQSQTVGIVSFPAVGSDVLVGFINPAVAVVLLTTEITKTIITIGETNIETDAEGVRIDTAKMSAYINKEDIVFNGGNNEGLIIIQKLTDKLNELTQTVNDLISAYNTHTHVCAAPQSPSATTLSQANPAQQFNKSDYEDNKVKH